MVKSSSSSTTTTSSNKNDRRTSMLTTTATATAADRVVLNVGGTTFVTTKSTLSTWSSPLSEMVTAASDSNKKEPLFIDVDPDAFAVLLSFMRTGNLEEPATQVTDTVLQQATHYQIHGLLTLVRNIPTITINIRGNRIQTSKRMLMDQSTFFRKQLSGPHNAFKLSMFLDYNPTDFAVLLEYMTRRHIEDYKLTNSVLELAEILGVERLVQAVKIKLCCSSWDYETSGSNLAIRHDEQQALDTFQQTYGTIRNAIVQMTTMTQRERRREETNSTTTTTTSTNLLDYYCPEKTKTKPKKTNNRNLDYVSIYLHRKSNAFSKSSIRLPFRATVYGAKQSMLPNAVLRTKDTINLLNMLGTLGFVLVQDPYVQNSSFVVERNDEVISGLGHVLANIVMCRCREDENRRNDHNRNNAASRKQQHATCGIVPSTILCTSSSSCMNNDNETNELLRPKEYVALLRPAQELQTAAGIGGGGSSHGSSSHSLSVKLVIPSSDSAPQYWTGGSTFLKDPPDPGFHGALAWLSRHGFHSSEPILAEAFTSALEELIQYDAEAAASGDDDTDHDDYCGWASILVFSKPIEKVVVDDTTSSSPPSGGVVGGETLLSSTVMVDSGSTMESTISSSASLDGV